MKEIDKFREYFDNFSAIDLDEILEYLHDKNFLNKCGEQFANEFWNWYAKKEYSEEESEEDKKEVESAVEYVLRDWDKLGQIYKRVNQTLKNVGYAPFDVVDNIEMFYTLQLIRDVLKEVLGE